MVVIPDPFLSLLQVLPFGVTFVGLYLILWKPLLDYLDGREAATSGARSEADHLAGEIVHQVADLEDRLREARAEITAERAAARARAAKVEAEMLAEARRRAEAHVSAALVELNEARAQAAAQVDGIARGLSASITESVLGRPAQG
jgi:F-type H+-transporting ATPase subunit b